MAGAQEKKVAVYKIIAVAQAKVISVQKIIAVGHTQKSSAENKSGGKSKNYIIVENNGGVTIKKSEV